MSPLVRGVLWGGILTLGASFFLRGCVRRRAVLIGETELGEIRISREAMQDLIAAYCQQVEGVSGVRARAMRRGSRTVIDLEISVGDGMNVASTVGQLVSALYQKMEDVLRLGPGNMTVVLSQIRVS
ncbi:MAG: hypothetical protein R6U70_09245 [Bacillota bacterium]